ncbi:MAG: hypothetical protein WCK95_27750 [Alphaproteobacteria bacterium]
MSIKSSIPGRKFDRHAVGALALQDPVDENGLRRHCVQLEAAEAAKLAHLTVSTCVDEF